MDGQAWLDLQDPEEMLSYLKDVATPRQMRLLGCACVRLLWENLQNDVLRQGVVTAERFADGLATADELAQANLDSFSLVRPIDLAAVLSNPAQAAARAASMVTDASPRFTLGQTIQMALACASPWQFQQSVCISRGEEAARAVQQVKLCRLTREIIGNPFQPVQVEADWLAWNNGVVGQLAGAIYAEQRWQDLPVLADALEEAGCDNVEMLAHCRGRGTHVRGCWAVDLLLGRN